MKSVVQKPFLVSLFTALFVALLSGCGETVAESDERGPDDIAYLAEVIAVDGGANITRSLVAQGDYLYFLSGRSGENGEWATFAINKVSLLDGSSEEISLSPWADNQGIGAMTINAQGNFLIATSEWSQGSGQMSQTLYEVAPSGEKISEIDVGEVLGLNESRFLQEMFCDNKNNLYFVINDSWQYQIIAMYQIAAMDTTGQVLGQVQYNGYIDEIIYSAQGEVYITAWGENGMVFKKADFAGGVFGGSGDIQLKGLENWGNLRFASGGPSGILASDGTSLFACDFTKSEATKILDWLDCGINGHDVQYFGQHGDGAYWVWRPDTSELIVLHQTTYGELPPRETIMLGTISLDPYLREAILEFNNRNQRYRVEVKDYATPGDHEAGELAFHLALTTTGGLDLVAFGSTSYGEFTNLATKGALEDLQPYFEGNGLDRRDYFENILDLYAIEGKLYGATPGFTLGALAAHASKLEGIDGWTVAEMMAWAEGYPGAILLDAVPLYILILLDAGRFIDWENGEVSYASDEFISVLELAATFDNAWDFQETEPLGMHESFASGYYLLYQAGITDLTDMQFVDALFDGEAKYMGYPAADGGDIFVVPRSTLAISSQSEHKEGAFAFLAYLLSDAYQVRGEETSLPFIPIKKSGAEALVAWQTTERRGVLGEQSLTSWEMDDLNVEIYASRNRDYVNDFYDLIARADTMRANDSAVLAIVREEAESYFAGQKTAWEAAEIIQNRVQVYVNEGR